DRDEDALPEGDVAEQRPVVAPLGRELLVVLPMDAVRGARAAPAVPDGDEDGLAGIGVLRGDGKRQEKSQDAAERQTHVFLLGSVRSLRRVLSKNRKNF